MEGFVYHPVVQLVVWALAGWTVGTMARSAVARWTKNKQRRQGASTTG